MTTEILRSMLYRGADLIRDIEFVVFDEVHYVNDSERGVVWEEVIIMLPAYVNLIFLSATTPNTFEFSDWIGRTKRRRVYVIKTDYRPVPLSHYLWANLKLHKIKEGNSGFFDKGYQQATAALRPKDKSKSDGGKQKKKAAPKPTGRGPQNMAWQAQGGKSQWMSLVRFLEREDLLPTVVFSFSKKKCEEIANMLRSLSLNTASETAAIQGFTLQTVARLSPIDRSLPQVLAICEMVKRGIGIHHGGLLPILKEMVEVRTIDRSIDPWRIHRATACFSLAFAMALAQLHRAGFLSELHFFFRFGADSVFSKPYQGAVCDRDVRHGGEHAGESRCLQFDSQTRRYSTPGFGAG